MHHTMCLFTAQLTMVLTLPTHGGIAQAELNSVAGSVPRWFTRPKMALTESDVE